MQPYAIRQAVVTEFQLTLKNIPDARPTATGFTVKLAITEIRNKVIKPKNKLRLSGILSAEAVKLLET